MGEEERRLMRLHVVATNLAPELLWSRLGYSMVSWSWVRSATVEIIRSIQELRYGELQALVRNLATEVAGLQTRQRGQLC